ncbi:MAG TPA: DUF1704 domain-containing protein, partial [Candidatus Absconditabacterales bacterium]|nr:DUF1704 domain-containing protein [Candidatus Absconditabacterales bacterium]
DNATIFLNSYMQQFKRLRKEVEASVFLNEVQKKLFLSTLQSYCLKIMLFKSAVYIEGEKGGYILDSKDKSQYLRNIERIETIVYGPKISDTPKEVDTIMSHLHTLYETNKEKLTGEEQEQFAVFLQNFASKRTETQYEDVSSKNRLGRLRQEDFAKLLQKGLAIYMITSNIVKITDKVSELKEENGILYIPAINVMTGKAQTQEELDAIYTQFGYNPDILKIKIHKCSSIEVDIPNKEINIPSVTNYYNVIRSLELLSHEEITHAITGTNKENKFNIESDTYLELQEGVAMLNEKAVATHIKDISAAPTIHHLSTFIGENYNYQDTYNLLKIYYTLMGKKNAESLAKTRTERVKRFHANDQGGANRKDVVYRRGIIDVLAYIQNLDPNKIEDIQGLQKNIFNFNIGKLGKEEVENAAELTEGFNITPKNIILPADIGKILLHMLEKNSPDGKGIKITNDRLGANDIRFKASLPEHNLNYTQKKLLLEMRSFIEHHREE